MINLLNRSNISTIKGGSWYVCQLRNQVVVDRPDVYYSDEKAEKICCAENDGLQWWNKGKGECSEYIAKMAASKSADKEMGCFSSPKALAVALLATESAGSK